MSVNSIDIRIVNAPPTEGVPYPEESYDPVRLTDPKEFRDALGAQAEARRLLPCIDTRATHWRYYLFAAPSHGQGRPIAVGKRLLSVLKQTDPSLAGVGRRDFRRFEDDGRSSKRKFVRKLVERFETAYSSAAKAFWGTEQELPENYPSPPSSALCDAARDYVLRADYEDFFEGRADRLRQMFRARLISFRPGLARLIISNNYDLIRAAAAASSSSWLNDSDRLLFFSWAVLQAYYKIADDGTDPEPEGEEGDEMEAIEDEDEYYRSLANASLDLLDRLQQPGELTQKQVNTIRNRLKTARSKKGIYDPPVTVWPLKNDGRRRQVFASLRLYAFRRLLRATRARHE